MTLYHRFLADTQRDYTFTGYANDLSGYVKSATWQFGTMGAYESIGTAGYMEWVLSNANGEFNLDDPNAFYYGKLRRGTLVRAQGSRDGITWTNLCTLKIQSIIPSYQMAGDHEVTLRATDITQDFFNKDFVPPLQFDVTVDEAIEALHQKTDAIYPYESYYQFFGHTQIGDGRGTFYHADWIDFETAATTLAYIGDNLGRDERIRVQQYLKDAVQAEVFGIYYFSPRTEKFTFLSRNHATDTAVSWNIDTTITDVPRYTYGRDLINDFALSYYPRALGDANSLLWESDSVPFQLSAQERKTITVKYRNPDYPTASVGALTIDPFRRGTDYIANSESDGSGEDWTRFIIPTVIPGVASTTLILYNRKVGDPAYITTLKLYGTPITAYNKETVYSYSDDSVFGVGEDESSGNDRASGSEVYFAVSDIDFAQNIADFKTALFNQPILALERVTIPVKPNDTITETNVLSHTVGDVINFQDPANNHDLDYMIVAEQHTVDAKNDLHTVTYTLRPTARGNLFILGVSNSNDGDVLGF